MKGWERVRRDRLRLYGRINPYELIDGKIGDRVISIAARIE